MPAIVVESEFLFGVVDEFDIEKGQFICLYLAHHLFVGDEIFLARFSYILLSLEILPSFNLKVSDHFIVVRDESIAKFDYGLFIS